MDTGLQRPESPKDKHCLFCSIWYLQYLEQYLAPAKYSTKIRYIEELIPKKFKRDQKASPPMCLEIKQLPSLPFLPPSICPWARCNWPSLSVPFFLLGCKITMRPLPPQTSSVIFFQIYIFHLVITCKFFHFQSLHSWAPCFLSSFVSSATFTVTAFQLHWNIECFFSRFIHFFTSVPSTSHLNSYFLFSSCLLLSTEQCKKNPIQQDKCHPL